MKAKFELGHEEGLWNYFHETGESQVKPQKQVNLL